MTRHLRVAGHDVTSLLTYEVEVLFGDDLTWQLLALCAETDPDLFFPEKGGSTLDAKKVCGECVVRPDCLEAALANNEQFGIFGGLSERERRKIKRDRAQAAGDTRRCEQCGEDKPTDSFRKYSPVSDGRQNWCNTCRGREKKARLARQKSGAAA